MSRISNLKPVLKKLERILAERKPSNVKTVKVFFEFEDIGYYELETILMGMVKVHIETEDGSTVRELMGVSETYHDQPSKQKAKDYIIRDVENILTYDTEGGEYDSYWEELDLEQQEWTKNDTEMVHPDKRESDEWLEDTSSLTVKQKENSNKTERKQYMEKQVYRQMSEFFSNEIARKRFKLGLSQLDGFVGGIEKGNVIVIMGQSVDGRDAMLNTLVRNMAIDQQIPSLFLNLGTNERIFYYRLESNINRVCFEEVREDGTLPIHKSLEDAELYVEFPAERKIEYIEKTIRDYAAKGIELVFIDSFQMIDCNDNDLYYYKDSLLLKEKVAKRLYALAKDMNLMIIIGSTVSNRVEYSDGLYEELPQIQDLMHAGRLDEYSDLVLGTYIPYAHQHHYNEDIHDAIIVSVLKNNINMKMGKFKMHYDLYHYNIWDNKEYNKQLFEEMKAENSVINEMAVGMDLELADNDE